MNKLKSTFLRTHSTRHSDDRRSQQFAKKLNAAQFRPYDTPTASDGPPTLHLDELTEQEQSAYQSWWKDLDPFSIGHLDNEAVLKFLRGCCLPDHKLEQILRFFEDTVDGLDELQFYAMLRLIAHAQNGRTISRDMVFLGAPVPRFQTNAIDALIKPAMNDLATPQMEPATAATLSKSALGSTGAWPSATQATRNSWIDTTTTTARPHQQQQAQQQQQQPQRPTSWYVGQPAMQQPVDVFVPSAPFMSPPQQAPPRQQQQQSSVTSSSCQSQHNSESSSTAGSSSQQQFNHGYQNQQQPQHIQQGTAPSAQHPWGQLPLQPTTSAAVPTKTDTQKYTHSRSRSVPYSVPQPPIQTEPKTSGEQENLFVFDTVAATPTKQQQQQQRPAPLTSRVSMDADSFQKLSSAIDTGQSLLLTKKFVPPKASNNPFESAIEESPKKEPVTALTYSPFADDVQQPLPQQQQQPNQQQQQQNQSSAAAAADPTIAFPDTPPRQDSVDSPQASAPPWPISKTNDHPNKHNIYPPPVPPQATKPAFLKYARNVVPPSYLRRTRSYGTRDRAPSDPFNSNDTTSFITTTTTTTTNTTFNYNDIATPTASSSSTASPFYSTEPHFGTKLFRHRSDGSSLIRR